MKALILCGGLGTRIRSKCKTKPKCMIKVGGKPVLEHLVEHLNSYGITEIVVNLHYLPNEIMDYFGTQLLYSFEPELLGAEKTILGLQRWLGERFIVMNGDTLTNVNLFKMMQFYASCRFMDGEIFAGTEIVHFNSSPKAYYEPEAYWVDMGTPAGLAKARRHYSD